MCDAHLDCFHTYGWHMQHREKSYVVLTGTQTKGNVSLYTMKAHWGMEIQWHSFLNSELEGGQAPAALYPGNCLPELSGTFWIATNKFLSLPGFEHRIIQPIVLYCIVVGSRRLMPPDALQPNTYCTNPDLHSFLLAPPGVSTRDPISERRNYLGEKWPMNFAWKCPTST